MAYSDKMEFKFEAQVANLTTAEKYKLAEGNPATITVRRGALNNVAISITASHSGMHGPNPDPDTKDDDTGFPYVSTYRYTWTVDVDESSNVYTIGVPKEETKLADDFSEVSSKVTTDYDRSNTKYVAVNIEVSFKYFATVSSGQQHFACRLLAEKPKEPPKPKIRKETVVVGSFAFGDYTVQKIKPLGAMLDYSKLSAWYNKLPERTRDSILNGRPPGGQKVVLTGYTDNVGDEHLNFALGTKRAVAVLQTLEKISGSKWKDIAATPSKGEQDVRVEQKNLEKKEPKHRRVEIAITIEE